MQDEMNELTYAVIGACIEVHENLGPGLLESVYQRALEIELEDQGIEFQRKVKIPLYYKDVDLGKSFEADLIIEDRLILEIKSVSILLDVHFKQLLTYLRLSDIELGLLLNFNESIMKKGVRRVGNGVEED